MKQKASRQLPPPQRSVGPLQPLGPREVGQSPPYLTRLGLRVQGLWGLGFGVWGSETHTCIYNIDSKDYIGLFLNTIQEMLLQSRMKGLHMIERFLLRGRCFRTSLWSSPGCVGAAGILSENLVESKRVLHRRPAPTVRAGSVPARGPVAYRWPCSRALGTLYAHHYAF